MFQPGDRVKVSPDHYGTGLQNRLGTVSRSLRDQRVEVELDSFYQAGIGIVTFKEGDLMPTSKKKSGKGIRKPVEEL